jgi:hypothetical protein
MELVILEQLPVRQQVEILTDICSYLNDIYICPDLLELDPDVEPALDLGTSIDATDILNEFE